MAARLPQLLSTRRGAHIARSSAAGGAGRLPRLSTLAPTTGAAGAATAAADGGSVSPLVYP